MKAVGVTYADEINKATEKWGLEQAIIQSLIDMSAQTENVAGIPEGAMKYAASYAAVNGKKDLGSQWPEANIMAAAWWVIYLYRTYGDLWSAIKAYYEMSPVGEAKMNRIYYVLYPKWQKAWRNL